MSDTTQQNMDHKLTNHSSVLMSINQSEPGTGQVIMFTMKMKKMMLKNPEKFGIKLPIEDCITETDEEGDCVSASACEAIAGINGGPCHLGNSNFQIF